jgi:ATP-dependent DNA helicase RecQ
VSKELMQQRIANKKMRAEAMIAILENDSVCRMQQLVNYFDEKTEVVCGACDVCQKDAPLNLEDTIVQFTQSGGISLQQLVTKFPSVSSRQIKSAVEVLLDSGKLSLSKTGKLILSEA